VSKVEGRSFEEKLLRHVIHEVATSLTIILCHAQLLEIEAKRKATAQISAGTTKHCLGREQDSIAMIIHQVHQIDQLLMTMANTVSHPGNAKDDDEYA
jgi:hypothetical protein